MRAEPKAGPGSPFEGALSARPFAKRASVLRGPTDFEAVLRSRLRVTSRHFVARASPNSIGHARLGIIAARKVATRAVDRNRGKRLIREAFRASAAQLGGHDVTVQLRSDLRDEVNRMVQAELSDLLQSLARLCAAHARRDSEAAPDRQ